jgi:hypothetical protein
MIVFQRARFNQLLPKKLERCDITTRRGDFRSISGRNQLVGGVLEIKIEGLIAQVTLAIGE